MVTLWRGGAWRRAASDALLTVSNWVKTPNYDAAFLFCDESMVCTPVPPPPLFTAGGSATWNWECSAFGGTYLLSPRGGSEPGAGRSWATVRASGKCLGKCSELKSLSL